MLTFLLVGGYYARSIPVWISWVSNEVMTVTGCD